MAKLRGRMLLALAPSPWRLGGPISLAKSLLGFCRAGPIILANPGPLILAKSPKSGPFPLATGTYTLKHRSYAPPI